MHLVGCSCCWWAAARAAADRCAVARPRQCNSVMLCRALQVDLLQQPASEHASSAVPDIDARGRKTFLQASASQQQQRQRQRQHPEQGQQEQPEPPQMPIVWMLVLWQRALQHCNPRVQHWALRAFLQRSWAAAGVSQLPGSFVVEVLLPAFCQPVHHKAAVTDGNAAFDAPAAVRQLICSWVEAAAPGDCRQLLTAGLAVVDGASGSAGRWELLGVLAAAAAAASGAEGLTAGIAGPGAVQMHLLLPPCLAGLALLRARAQHQCRHASRGSSDGATDVPASWQHAAPCLAHLLLHSPLACRSHCLGHTAAGSHHLAARQSPSQPTQPAGLHGRLLPAAAAGSVCGAGRRRARRR